jgi:carboxymethylenebutenolidase
MSTQTRLTARDFHPDVLRLFDQYVHGQIDRRGFLQGAGRYAAGAAGAAGLLAALSPQFAAAQQVSTDDPRIRSEYRELDSPQGYGRARGYLSQPAESTAPLPTVLVVHENRGLNPHIEDITRRLALDGFMAFAPDALTPLGGWATPETQTGMLVALATMPAWLTRWIVTASSRSRPNDSSISDHQPGRYSASS